MNTEPGFLPVAAVVLAAGASTRMGQAKLLLPLSDHSLIRTVVQRIQAASLSQVVVVTGVHGPEIRQELIGLQVTFAESPDPTGPTSSSLHAGILALSVTTTAMVVVLPDMVRVTAEMFQEVTSVGNASEKPLTVSRYGDVIAPPLFFRRALFPELLAWHGDGCGKAVVRAHLEEANFLDWPVDRLADIDTPAEYQAFRSGK